MLLASSRTIPPAPVLSAFSEPAKSTRTIFPVFDLLVQSHIVVHLVILNLLKTRKEMPLQLNYVFQDAVRLVFLSQIKNFLAVRFSLPLPILTIRTTKLTIKFCMNHFDPLGPDGKLETNSILRLIFLQIG